MAHSTQIWRLDTGFEFYSCLPLKSDKNANTFYQRLFWSTCTQKIQTGFWWLTFIINSTQPGDSQFWWETGGVWRTQSQHISSYLRWCWYPHTSKWESREWGHPNSEHLLSDYVFLSPAVLPDTAISNRAIYHALSTASALSKRSLLSWDVENYNEIMEIENSLNVKWFVQEWHWRCCDLSDESCLVLFSAACQSSSIVGSVAAS